MPIAGNTPIPPAELRFFKTLTELDSWANSPSKKIEGILPYIPRNKPSETVASEGKILVCHDYKGGYVESPFSFSYTFNFWSTCDTFIYFAHQRVTVPPPAWINAAHRQGVKMLGVLIFENTESQDDLSQLFFGPLPVESNRERLASAPPSLPLSSHYARVLAELAYQRGFDGYLMNFEWSLPGGISQARALTAWVSLLRVELWKRVGSHAEVVWYDSVTAQGYLAWQDRLNSYNLPFLLCSTGFFTNYTWPTDYPDIMAQYFDSLSPSLLSVSSATRPNPTSQTLTRRDVYVGVDVWGRGTYGGGGFGTYRALEYVAPNTLKLSAALFAPGWTWETRENDVGRTWEKWWEEEVTLWAGLRPGFDPSSIVPEFKHRRREQPRIADDTYKGIADFFATRPPPDPSILPFMTIFSPGVGRGWWVAGEKVWDAVSGDVWTSGWQDIERQCSVGDLIWPIPKLEWVDGSATTGVPLPVATVDLSMDDAWNGGTSLKLSFSDSVPTPPAAGVRSVFVPIQSLSLTPGIDYIATVVYKIQGDSAAAVVVGLQANLLSSISSSNYAIGAVSDGTWSAGGNAKSVDVAWLGAGIRLNVSTTSMDATESDSTPVEVALGLVLTITQGSTGNDDMHLASLLVGQMNVFTLPSPNTDLTWESVLLWANFTPAEAKQSAAPTRTIADINGVLMWSLQTSLLPADPQTHPVISDDDPIPIYGQVPADGSWVETFFYYNIYAQLLTPADSSPSAPAAVGKPQDVVWIGTSGLDYGGDTGWETGRFIIVGENLLLQLPDTKGSQSLRFFVQGVNERGDVMEWDQVVFVDVDLGFTT
ncbi:glycosyl hydrolase family 85-domain-containing protein [Crucibulum laeve]|uniref:Glycosyl hydrolase family 85-domain-containing protein n=1 Tax=Crucibulum laeve TaxID=68775 RepID=A0A5C3LTK0_9AGAR|nr:glycosyl hydrolase family 85-domain-containing protein [Crucibulum laeve]